jgi:hypothetical protein
MSSKLEGWKINIQKSLAFPCINEQSAKEIRKTIPFTIASEKLKYLGVCSYFLHGETGNVSLFLSSTPSPIILKSLLKLKKKKKKREYLQIN